MHLCTSDGLAHGFVNRRICLSQRLLHVAPGVFGVRLFEHFDIAIQ